jgi:hypothetical protein
MFPLQVLPPTTNFTTGGIPVPTAGFLKSFAQAPTLNPDSSVLGVSASIAALEANF